jgi:hypothetical protein
MIIEKLNRKTQYFDKKLDKVINRNEKILKLKCDKCDIIHERSLNQYKKMKENELFSNDYCNICWRLILNRRPEKIEKMKLALKKIWESEDKRKEMSDLIRSKVDISGDKNPMKSLEIRNKVSKTRSEGMTLSMRKKYSNGTKKAWEDGKFIGVNNCWKCLWYDYKHSNGKVYKVQGTWELKFIEWLDKNNLTFECHRGKIPYIDDEGKCKNYYPDFFVYNWNVYVDIKSTYTFIGQSRKFEILKSNNNKIQILFKEDLKNLGIKIC